MSEERTVRNPALRQEQDGQEWASADAAIDVGHCLRAAREARGISIDEASMALKLSSRQVEALETNDWFHLPRTVTRGFVRNYARYLELDAVPLMAAMDGVQMPQGPELAVSDGAPVSMPREGRGDRRDYVRVAAGLLILALALLAYFFVPTETWRSTLGSIKALVSGGQAGGEAATAPAETSGQESDAPAAPEAMPVPVTPALETAPAPATLPPAAVPAPAAPAPAASSALAPAASSASDGTLVFSFDRQSWVEVRERGGKIVFSQLNPAGSQREVVGQPPFSLIVGNAAHVTLQYKGKPVDLSQRSRDDVARLTLE
jgi:cytoskeleton protein RodZ